MDLGSYLRHVVNSQEVATSDGRHASAAHGDALPEQDGARPVLDGGQPVGDALLVDGDVPVVNDDDYRRRYRLAGFCRHGDDGDGDVDSDSDRGHSDHSGPRSLAELATELLEVHWID